MSGPTSSGPPGLGDRVGPWLLEAEAGRGAMAIVFRARDEAGRVVALKVPRADALLRSPLALQRLEREGRVVAGLSHPGIVALVDSGVTGGWPWLAYELVEGATPLDEAFAGAPLARRVRWVRDAARALGAAHAAGVLHRDVAPGNVLVDATGRARVADFGLAWVTGDDAITRTGVALGTPGYLAPEVALEGSRAATPAADVWSLGVLLFLALTGRHPFAGQAFLAGLMRAREGAPRAREAAPEVPVALDSVCARALAPDPGDRWPDGEALARALEAAVRATGDASRRLHQVVAQALAGPDLDAPHGPAPGPRADPASARLAAPGPDPDAARRWAAETAPDLPLDAHRGPAAPTPAAPSARLLAARPPAPGPGQRLGPYRVVGRLGEGGMGLVLRAVDDALGREVALKVTPAERVDPERLARFAREVEAAARVRHPHLVAVHAAGEDDGWRWLAMELVPGEGLDARLRREGALPPREAVALARDLALALGALHAAGVLHRDVKPSNVLLDAQGGARLTDLGVARVLDDGRDLTRTGQAVGTPLYMAPELLTGRKADVRGDVYGLGATLYELLTGQLPHTAESMVELLARKQQPPAPPSSRRAGVDRALDAVLLGCLDPDPARRYAAAEDVALELGRWLDGAAPRPPASAGPRPGGPLRARGGAVAVGAAAGALALAALLWALLGAPPPRVRLERARVDAASAAFAARELAALDLASAAAVLSAVDPGDDRAAQRAAGELRAWVDLAALARGERVAAPPAREGADGTAEVALRGALAALEGDPVAGLDLLDRARRGGLGAREVDRWRALAVARGGVPSPARALEVLDEVAARAGGLDDHRLRAARVAALAALGRRAEAEAGLAALGRPGPELARAVGLLGVEEALARGDLDLAAGRAAALPAHAPAEAGAPADRQGGRPPSSPRERAAAARALELAGEARRKIERRSQLSDPEQRRLARALEVHGALAPDVPPLALRGPLLIGLDVLTIGQHVDFAPGVAAAFPDDPDVQLAACKRVFGAETPADAARFEAIARRAHALCARPDQRLTALLVVSRALSMQARFADALALEPALTALRAEVDRAGALSLGEVGELTGQLHLAVGIALRGLGRLPEALAALEEAGRFPEVVHGDAALERARTLAALGRPGAALDACAAHLLSRGDVPSPRTQALLELAWQVGTNVGRWRDMEQVVARGLASERPSKALWQARAALRLARLGDHAGARELLGRVRRESPGAVRLREETLEGVARGDPAALDELTRALEAAAASFAGDG